MNGELQADFRYSRCSCDERFDDDRVKQWWADELTDAELEQIASGSRTVAQVLQARSFAAQGRSG